MTQTQFTKQSNFLKAVQRLSEAVVEYQGGGSTTVRDGVIQRFEFTFELAWKSLKEYLIDQGVSAELQFPKRVLREAYAAGIINQEAPWLDMLQARNTTSHVYDDKTAAAIAAQICGSFLPELQALAQWYQA